MLGHGEIDSAARFTQDDMTSDLAEDDPPGVLKGLDGTFAGDIGETSHGLDGDDDLMLAVMEGLGGGDLLILGPEPGVNGFLDIGECFLFVFALGDAAGEGGALGDEPAVFRVFNGDMKQHG